MSHILQLIRESSLQVSFLAAQKIVRQTFLSPSECELYVPIVSSLTLSQLSLKHGFESMWLMCLHS